MSNSSTHFSAKCCQLLLPPAPSIAHMFDLGIFDFHSPAQSHSQRCVNSGCTTAVRSSLCCRHGFCCWLTEWARPATCHAVAHAHPKHTTIARHHGNLPSSPRSISVPAAMAICAPALVAPPPPSRLPLPLLLPSALWARLCRTLSAPPPPFRRPRLRLPLSTCPWCCLPSSVHSAVCSAACTTSCRGRSTTPVASSSPLTALCPLSALPTETCRTSPARHSSYSPSPQAPNQWPHPP